MIPEVNIQLKAGKILWICGRNGSGKSFLLQTLLGLRKFRVGSLINTFASVSYLPQLHELRSHLPYSLREALPSDFSREEVLALELLQENNLHQSWNSASGGEKQRTLLTRVLLESRDLLVLDEPTNHLDRASKERFWHLLEQRMDPQRQALILVSHEEEVEKRFLESESNFSWEKLNV